MSCTRILITSRNINLIPDKVNFRIKLIRRGKANYYILSKRTTQHEELTIINLYVLNTGAPNFIKHVLLNKKRLNKHLHSHSGWPQSTFKKRQIKQKCQPRADQLKHTLEQLDLLDVYRRFYPITTQHTFSAALGTFGKCNT